MEVGKERGLEGWHSGTKKRTAKNSGEGEQPVSSLGGLQVKAERRKKFPGPEVLHHEKFPHHNLKSGPGKRGDTEPRGGGPEFKFLLRGGRWGE